MLEPRQVHSRVDHQGIEGAARGTECLDEGFDALQIPQIHRQVGHRSVGDRQGGLGTARLIGITAGHHNVPAAVGEGLGGEQADAGGRPSDQDGAGSGGHGRGW